MEIRKWGAAERPDLLEHLQCGPAAIGQGAAVLVGAGVVFAQVADGGDLHHVKAQAPVLQGVVGDLLDPILNFLRGGHPLVAAAPAEGAHTAHAPGGHAGPALGADLVPLGSAAAHAGRASGTARTAGAEGSKAAGPGLREAQALGQPPVALHHTQAAVGVDPVDHPNHIVVDKGVVHGEQGRVAPEVPVQLRQGGRGHGDDRRAVLRGILNEADGAFRRVVLRALLLLGVALAHAHAGTDDDIAHPNGRQDVFVPVVHRDSSFMCQFWMLSFYQEPATFTTAGRFPAGHFILPAVFFRRPPLYTAFLHKFPTVPLGGISNFTNSLSQRLCVIPSRQIAVPFIKL